MPPVRHHISRGAGLQLAAVADWHVVDAGTSKIKKGAGGLAGLRYAENPDILAHVGGSGVGRPGLVIGFAAETDDLEANAAAKLARKGCDWIVANDVRPETGIMGGTENAVVIVEASGVEAWPRLGTDEVARRLAARIARHVAP
ncbi:MAG: phosphopantothenoylcysteine decarboxylase domain-containing protein [Shimia sp.]